MDTSHAVVTELPPPAAEVSDNSEKSLVDADNKQKFERTGIGTQNLLKS